jgi:L-threonylcarbamoyladenylate synthase
MRISVEKTVALLRHDEVVAVPTETVYGLAASLYSEQAVDKIYALKGRPQHNPLIIHVKDSQECLPFLLALPASFNLLTSLFWPGPLTLVLPVKEESIPAPVRSSLPRAAFRAPSHPLLHEVLQSISPLVAPSANISGKPSATHPSHIERDFGEHFPILDGGISHHGLESTILIYNEERWHIGRYGALPKEQLEKVLGYSLEALASNTPLCPGQLFRHYAPSTKLILSTSPHGPYVVGFEDRSYPNLKKLFSLGSSCAPEQAAGCLYNTLRQLDLENILEAMCDISMPENGLWLTILERLNRAASR